MSALGRQLGQLRVRSCERDSLWTGLAGPTNNDVCLNGAGAALTLYTPCQFPPVRHSVNCCRHSVNLISSEKSSGFLRSWHLDLHRGDLSSEELIGGLFDTCQWLVGSCHQICQNCVCTQLKCRHPSGFCHRDLTASRDCHQSDCQVTLSIEKCQKGIAVFCSKIAASGLDKTD